jgi:hypothetical protein
MIVGLAAHRIGFIPIHFGEPTPGFLEGEGEMVGEALDVAFLEGDDGIGATISRAFGAIVRHGRAACEKRKRALSGFVRKRAGPKAAPPRRNSATSDRYIPSHSRGMMWV